MTREDFQRIPELRKEINHALILWENAISLATNITSVLTGMPKSQNVSSKVENAVIKSETFKERYDKLCEEQKDIYRRLNAEISRLSEIEQNVIKMAYPQGKRMSEIAKALHITERHVYRVKTTAIKKLCH